MREASSLGLLDEQRANLADELAGHLLADGLDRTCRADPHQDPGGARSGQVGVRPSMQHPPGLPHPALKIRGTRS